jgi:hypothetical protein
MDYRWAIKKGIPLAGRTEVKIDLEEVASIRAKADGLGKADCGWESELKDANDQIVTVCSNRYQLRTMKPLGA